MWGALKVYFHQHLFLFRDLKDFWSSECPLWRHHCLARGCLWAFIREAFVG